MLSVSTLQAQIPTTSVELLGAESHENITVSGAVLSPTWAYHGGKSVKLDAQGDYAIRTLAAPVDLTALPNFSLFVLRTDSGGGSVDLNVYFFDSNENVMFTTIAVSGDGLVQGYAFTVTDMFTFNNADMTDIVKVAVECGAGGVLYVDNFTAKQ